MPQDVLDFVRERAADDLQVSVPEVEIDSARQVTWPSTALGCPEPGRTYAQVLVPGYLIIVSAGDESLNVHMSTEGQVKLCPPGQGEPPVGG